MDDETRTYKTQIKGLAYSFAPFAKDDITMIVELSYMGASGSAYTRAAMQVLKGVSEPEQWAALTDRLVSREIGLEDLATAFTKLFERQVKELEKRSDDAE